MLEIPDLYFRAPCTHVGPDAVPVFSGVRAWGGVEDCGGGVLPVELDVDKGAAALTPDSVRRVASICVA